MSGYIIIILFLLSIIGFFLDLSKDKNKTKSFIFYVLIILMFILAASKNENTSFDTSNYVEHFNKSQTLSTYVPFAENWYEPGYIFLVSVIKTITNNYNILFGVISFLSLSLLSFISKKYSPYPLISLFVYISLFYFKRDIITIRYGLSSLFLLYGIILTINNECKKSILLYILAIMFHYSALAGLVFPIYYYIFKNKKVQVVERFVVICLLLSVVGINILFLIVKLSEILPPEIGFGISKGIAYLEEEESGGLKQIIPYIPFVLLCHKFQYKKYLKNFSQGLYLVLLLALFFMIELHQAESFARVNQLFLTSIILIIPILIKQSNLVKNKKLLISYSFIFCLYMFIRICFFNSGGFINVYW